MRYVYLGDALTEPALIGQPCDPVRRDDGKCIVSTRMASALVDFADGSRRVVKRRRLRVVATSCSLPNHPAVGGTDSPRADTASTSSTSTR